MPAFAYKARNSRGELLTGRQEGTSPEAVADELARSGLIPVEVRPAKATGEFKLSLPKLLGDRVSDLDLMLFVRQMNSLLKAGVPILRALTSLADSAVKPALRNVLNGIREGLAAGRELSVSLRRYPNVFPDFFVNMVRVGETTGRLEEVFLRLYHHYEFEIDMRERVKGALRYPAFVVVAILAAIVVINVVVIPAFAKVYAQAKVELPLLTRILIGTSDWMVHWWPLLLGLLVLIVIGFRLWVGTPAGAYHWSRLLLKLPIAGKIVHKAALARFAKSLAVGHASGLPITQNLTSVARVVDNVYLASRIEQMRDGVERGESLTRVAAAAGVFTPVVLQMLAVGEETGDIERLLNEVGDMYQRDVEYEVKALSDQIEPILIVVMGILVLIVALGVFLPLWDLGKTMLRR
ncbi:MSHA biogenesis protein MshG [Sulfuritortus calidifontis]|uniref:MSHA biogenesis protein MshG n=1 Tax=Sulfuritortus calidifontis TaxID=1914471 RepID=A0A4R3JV88_9PROT|nr:type II secretion system F family protein [Sulfuritortus calidifontis]TCS71885.1 MSHA biogenesis protein MshG [Sulfuritortus calidifontis]